ncbi:MAG: hypothetical protein ACK4GW_09875 [Pseudorhodobacter sp.]
MTLFENMCDQRNLASEPCGFNDATDINRAEISPSRFPKAPRDRVTRAEIEQQFAGPLYGYLRG